MKSYLLAFKLAQIFCFNSQKSVWETNYLMLAIQVLRATSGFFSVGVVLNNFSGLAKGICVKMKWPITCSVNSLAKNFIVELLERSKADDDVKKYYFWPNYKEVLIKWTFSYSALLFERRSLSAVIALTLVLFLLYI